MVGAQQGLFAEWDGVRSTGQVPRGAGGFGGTLGRTRHVAVLVLGKGFNQHRGFNQHKGFNQQGCWMEVLVFHQWILSLTKHLT